MPTYRVTDPDSGVTLKVTGESPPTELELEELFASVSTGADNPLTGELGFINNDDGTTATEKSITIGMGGKYYNLPTLVSGQINPEGIARGEELTQEQEKIAIERFRARGGFEQEGFSDIDSAIAAAQERSNAGGSTEKFRAPEPSIDKPIPTAQGVAESIGQGATLGFSDEIQSFVAAAVAAPFVSDKTFAQLMVDARKNIRDDQAQFEKEQPAVALASEIAGGVLTGGGAAKGAAKAGTKALAKQGAIFGGTAGAGFSDEDEFLSSETLESALTGSTFGAAFGAAAPKVIKMVASAGAKIPARLPEKMMESVMKIRPSVDQVSRKQMIRTALDDGILPSVKGLEKVANKLQVLNSSIDTIIDNATKDGIKIPASALFSQLKPLRQKVGGVKLDAAGDVGAVDKVAREFGRQLKKLGKNKLTPREVQDLKVDTYKRINFDLQQGQANFAKNEARSSIARASKEQLERLSPDVKPNNKKIGELLELQKELERSVSRLENNNVLSLDSGMKVAAGAAAGSPATGAAIAISGQPTVKARMALTLENMRKAGEIRKAAKDRLPPELMAVIANSFANTEVSLKSLFDNLAQEEGAQ